MSLTSAGDCTTAAEKARLSFLKAPRPSGGLVAGAAQRGRVGLHLQALVLLTAGYFPKPCARAGGPGVVVWVLKTSLKSEGWSC